MKLKKTLLTTALVLASSLALTSCGQKNDADNSNSNAGGGESAKGSVYYLNFKPEVEEVWNKIAKTYTDETGVPVKVVTAASGTYEKTLKGCTNSFPNQRPCWLPKLERLYKRFERF